MKWNGCTAAAAAILLMGGCSKKEEREHAPPPVRVEVVTGGVGGSSTRYSATIEPEIRVDLAFKVGGYVEEIASRPDREGRKRQIQEGDEVRKDEMLARIRDSEQQDRLTDAKSSLTQAKADFERVAQLFENHTSSKAEYDAALAHMTSSQARYDQAELAIGDCTLRAPMSGTVMKRAIEIGTLASPGTPAFVIADTRAVKAMVGVPDVVVGSLKIGQKQKLTAEAIPGEVFEATITRISPYAEAESRMFDVEFASPNADGRLKPGMIATIEFAANAVAASASTPVLPSISLNAVVRPPGAIEGYAVYVVEEAEGKPVAKLRPVVPGDVSGNRIAIQQGLAGGERVIVLGATLVNDGQEVRVIP